MIRLVLGDIACQKTTAINDDVSSHLKTFEAQYLNNQASDHPGPYLPFAHIFTLFRATVSIFKTALL